MQKIFEKFLKKKDLLFYSIVTVLITIAISCFTDNLSQKICFSKEPGDIEYQAEAINLLRYQKFPYVGFYSDLASYNIDSTCKLGLSGSTYIKIIKENKPIINVSRPPVFPLYLAGLYGIFGNQTSTFRIANIFFIVFIAVFSAYAGHILLNNVGFFVGGLSGIIFLGIKYADIYDLSPNIFINFLVFLTFLITITFSTPYSRFIGFIIGALLALLLMVKGHLIFIPTLFFLYLLYIQLSKKCIKSIFFVITGFLFVFLPWVLFANIMLFQTKNERAIWKKNLLSQINGVKVYKTPFIKPYTHIDSILMTENIKHQYSFNGDDGIIFLSKQANWILSHQLIFGHNELCVDGWVHEEAPYVKSLYCNNFHQDKSGLMRVLYFYKDNPSYLYKIALGKYQSITSLGYKYFILTTLFLGLMSLLSFFEKRWLWVCITLLTLGLYFLLPFKLSVFIFIIMGVILLSRLLYLAETVNIPPFLLSCVTNNLLIIPLMAGVNRFSEVIDSVSILSAFLIGYIVLHSILSGIKPFQKFDNRLPHYQ